MMNQKHGILLLNACFCVFCIFFLPLGSFAFSPSKQIQRGDYIHYSKKQLAEEKMTSLRINKSMKELANQYSSFLIDQFGVIHNGTHPYEGAVEVIEEIAKQGKKMVILSNSSKRKGVAIKNLRKMGFNPDHFCEIVTSGNTAFEAMLDRSYEPFKSLGTKCLVLGNGDDDAEYVDQIKCSLSTVEDAEFILARGNFVVHGANGVTRCDQSESSENYVQDILNSAAARKVPMLVTNPDVLRPGCNSPMPGILGEKYENLGGDVYYVGKPHMAVYEKCIEALGEDGIDRSKICAVGDSLGHDILGACRVNIDSIFIIGGVHASQLKIEQGRQQIPDVEDLQKLYQSHNAMPTHAIPAFVW